MALSHLQVRAVASSEVRPQILAERAHRHCAPVGHWGNVNGPIVVEVASHGGSEAAILKLALVVDIGHHSIQSAKRHLAVWRNQVSWDEVEPKSK